MKLVKVSDLFDIKYGNGLSLQDCKKDNDGIPFVSRGSQNNGIDDYIEELEDEPINLANTISVAVSGSVMEAFLQKRPYYTGYHVLILTPKESMTDVEMLYYCTCLRANKYRYSYGRQANKTLKDILIPDKTEIPQWVLTAKINLPSAIPLKSKETPILNTDTWKEFMLTELFSVKGSKTTPLDELEEYGKGKYPYITTQAVNNGVAGFYDFYTEQGNCLTVDSAVLGYCSYRDHDFSASDHVEILKPKFSLNKEIALFLVTIINKEQYRYSYGRKASQTKLKNTKIKLPALPDGTPDWDFMENYIKSLPYGDCI